MITAYVDPRYDKLAPSCETRTFDWLNCEASRAREANSELGCISIETTVLSNKVTLNDVPNGTMERKVGSPTARTEVSVTNVHNVSVELRKNTNAMDMLGKVELVTTSVDAAVTALRRLNAELTCHAH